MNLVELPDSMAHIWIWFLELDSARTSSGFGPNPISYTEIQAYFNLIGVKPKKFEVRTIKRFDNAVLQIYAEKAQKSDK